MTRIDPLNLNKYDLQVECHPQPNVVPNSIEQQTQNPFLNSGFYNIPYSLYTDSLFTMPPMPPIDYSLINYPIFPTLPVGNSYDWSDLFKTSTPSVSTNGAYNGSEIKYTNTKNFSNTAKLGPDFLNKVKQVAKNVNCNYKDLLAVMNSESGINPHIRGSIAVGLIQFTDIAINALNQKYGLNLTKEKILAMSGVEQMDLVEKCIMMSKVTKFSKDAHLSGPDLYALIFLPARADREVLCEKGERNKKGKLLGYYESNPVDYDKDGKITKADLAARLARKGVDESRFMNVA